MVKVRNIFKSRKKGKEADRRSSEPENVSAASAEAEPAQIGDTTLHRSITSTSREPPTPQPTSLFPRPSFQSKSSKSSPDADPGPLGLSVVYTPDHGHKADIVFVHGLGGTSHQTWSKYKDPELFWPLTFLPLEPDVCLARILTFGYSANFRKPGNISSSVLDFAKELLFDLKFAKDQNKEDLDMGNVPLIFVVHSMGGLIVKEAYIQGQNDPEYQHIIKAISAITFLATPHRGTNLAEILNRILESSLISNSKQYIADLSKNSFTLQKLNEQFRHIAPRLDIVSFYETQPTSIGVKNLRVMVLEKDSSTLGYPGETSKSLNADHHGICKYEGPGDPNYITVRNVLKSLVSKIIATSRGARAPITTRRESHDVKTNLGIAELPDIDFIFYRDQWAEGTNDWILEDRTYLEWFRAHSMTGARILWLTGGAGTGKSVMSSFIINDLVERGCCCQYFFIRSSNKKKRTLSLLLRTIAYQAALSLPEFLKGIIELADQAIDFNTADPNTIWDRLFKSLLFQLDDIPPLYWIIDGLDEADSARTIVKQISSACFAKIPIKILLVSRRNSEIETAIQKASTVQKIEQISIEGHLEDIRCYIRQELTMPGSPEYKEYISQRVVDKSQNIFLWVRFVIDKLNKCYTDEDVELVFQELPADMEALYDRMALNMTRDATPRDKELASTILHYVTCSLRVLTVAELEEALGQDTLGVLDLQRAIKDLCGGFIVVDNGGNVAVIHETAREYLLSGSLGPVSVDRAAAHEQMFLSCMRSLMAFGLRNKMQRKQRPIFLDYAATWWSLHLISTPTTSRSVVNILYKFLTGQWVLVWIKILAVSRELRVLVQASKNLLIYCARQAEDAGGAEEGSDEYMVQHELFKSWAVDLAKIVGKFGTLLQRDSESIYKLIPPFCAHSSSIYQQFGKPEAKTLAVSGLSTNDWDDSLARLSTVMGTYTTSILTAGGQIAILTSPGNVFLYDSSIFEQGPASPIEHPETVYRIALNNAGTLLATYGYRTTKVWQISTGNCIMTIDNDESKSRPLAMQFSTNDTTLLVGTDNRQLRSIRIKEFAPSWELVAALDEPELEGSLFFLNSANYMALSPDGNLVAVAYRGHPTSAWEVDGQFHVGHCWRQGRENVNYGEVIDACWHPHYPELIGLYLEGVVFKWRPYEDTVCDEFPVTGVSKLQLSKDGNLFATGDVHGTVKIYVTADVKLIYQLSSQDPVLGLAFSPDLRRFYDIRGYYGNAWEPNALMRFAEQAYKEVENDSETESLAHTSTVSISACHWVDSVTTLSASPAGGMYSFGTEKGGVELYDARQGRLQSFKPSKSYLSIEAMAWSTDGKYLAFSDSSNTVFVHSVILERRRNSSQFLDNIVQVPMRMNTTGHVSQILFSEDSGYVLAATDSRISVISVASSTIVYTLELETGRCSWISHPRDPELIIGFGATKVVIILDWELRVRHRYSFELPKAAPGATENTRNNSGNGSGGPSGEADASNHYSSGIMPSGNDAVNGMVRRVLVTCSKNHILVQTSTHGQSSREKSFFVFATSSFTVSSPPSTSSYATNVDDHNVPSDTTTIPGTSVPITYTTSRREGATSLITPLLLPPEISSQTTLALSFLPDDRLITLSRNFSVCQWQLNLSPHAETQYPAGFSASSSTIPTGTRRPSSITFDTSRSLPIIRPNSTSYNHNNTRNNTHRDTRTSTANLPTPSSRSSVVSSPSMSSVPTSPFSSPRTPPDYSAYQRGHGHSSTPSSSPPSRFHSQRTISSPTTTTTGETSHSKRNSTTTTGNDNKNNHKQTALVPVNLFSLPGDWISRECLALCSIWHVEKSLLCPRNGEVAVVRCANLS